MFASHAALLQTLGWTLVHLLWQGALIAGVLFILNLFIKPSNVRYALACTALVLMLVAPVVSFGVLYEKPDAAMSATNQPPPSADVVTTKANQPLPNNELPTLPLEGQPQGIAPTEPLWNLDWRERLTNTLPYVVVLWLVGVVLLSSRLLLQWLYAERFKRKHTQRVSAELQQHLRVLALRLRVSRPVQLLESSLVDVPTVIGFMKPVILLPASALTGLSVGQLGSLLAHELAHVRRHDYFVNILQSVIETLLFYHPAVWWVSYRIRTEREHCCDDVAVSVSGNAVVYAKALERLETLRSQPQLALAASDGKLVSRIKRILGKPERSPNWLAGVVIATLLATFLFLGNTPEVEAQTGSETPKTYQKQIWLSFVGPQINITKDFPKVIELAPDNAIIFDIREGDDVKRLKITQTGTVQYYEYTHNDEVMADAGTGEIMAAFIDTWETIKVWQKGAAGPWGETLDVSETTAQSTWFQADSLPIAKNSFAFNAFGHTADGLTYISFVHTDVSNMPLQRLSEINVEIEPKKASDAKTWGRYIDSKGFVALDHVLQATQVVKQGLVMATTPIGLDFYIKNFVEDLLNNVKLNTQEMQATLELINELKNPEDKKELLLKYLDKVSSLNEVRLEQAANKFLQELDEANRVYEQPYLLNSPEPMAIQATPNTRALIKDLNERLDKQGSARFVPPLSTFSEINSFDENYSSSIKLRASSSNAPVIAMNNGIVLEARMLGYNEGYMVTISHADSVMTAYVGLTADLLVKAGQTVHQGDVIGYLGGSSFEPSHTLTLSAYWNRDGIIPFPIDPTLLYQN